MRVPCEGGRPAPAVEIGFCPSHDGDGVALPLGRGAWRRRTTEMQQAGLRARIGVDSQRVVILPVDVQSARHAHDRGGTVRLALIAGRLIRGRIPGVGHLRCRGGERKGLVVAAYPGRSSAAASLR